MRNPRAIAAAALIAFCATACAAEELVTLPVRDGVTESYLLVHDKSAMPKVVVVSFIGGMGAIDLAKRTRDGVARFGPGLSGFDFASIKIPLLWLHHRNDGCRLSPYAGAQSAAHGGAFISVSGGDPPQSGPCDPLSPHGYFGREDAATQAIRNYLLGHDYAREIG